MGSGWKNFEMPKKLVCDESTLTSSYGKFIAEPFERGYGTTIGNSLRRVLLSSIEGTAVASVKIEGVLHEFSTITGVVEDVPEIILNIKSLVLRSHSRNPKTIHINVEKKGKVSAKDIKTGETVDIINPDLHIATLSEKSKFKMEIEVVRGRGYVPAERNKREGQLVGVIPLDSIFSPVKRVNYHVENTRVGQMTDYDKLILEIWTNGSMTPQEALLHGANVLQKHLEVFVNFGKLIEEEEEEFEVEDKGAGGKLSMPVSEIELSVRSANCLKEARIKSVADLVQKKEPEMLKYRNFGKKSLAEIKEILSGMGLSLGMKIPKPPKEK